MADPAAKSDLDDILDRPKARRRWPWVVGVLVLALVAFLFLRSRNGEADAPRYRTVTLEKGDLTASVTATGQLKPTNQVDVGSELSGTVTEVLVDTNDEVTAGQPLAVLDLTKLQQTTERSRATVSSAQARVAQAQATLSQNSADLERFEEVSRLSGGKVPAKTELDAQRALVERAKGELQSAQAAVREASSTLRANESDLGKGVVKSPIKGIVLVRNIEPGQTVAASFTAPVLFTLAEDLARMELTVDVAEADVGQVKAGQTAQFTVDAWPGKKYRAQVLKIRYGSKVVENVVSYEAELEVANDDLTLRPGMTATADIQVAERKGVLVVPNAALRFTPPRQGQGGRGRQGGGFSLVPQPPRRPRPQRVEKSEQPKVYVLRDGEPVRVEVTVGLTDGKSTEISSPELKEGDEIILESLGSPS